MRVLLFFGLLVICAALNLMLNYYAPTGMKLLLVPMFAVAFVFAIKALRRPG